MIYEAILIIQSVEWTEKEINKRIKSLDKAREEFLIHEEELLEKEIQALIIRLNKELKNMDDFMTKYKGLIQNLKDEKKTLLSNTGKKK